MGVAAIPILEPLRNITMSKIEGEIIPPKGQIVGAGANGFILKHRYNDSFKAVNRLLKEVVQFHWTKADFTNYSDYYPAGTMIIQGGNNSIQPIADELGLDFYALENQFKSKGLKLIKPRLGLYKRYAGGNMDEGWTNWLLKEFEFEFTSLFNKDIKDTRMDKKYDVIIIPSDSYRTIVEGNTSKKTPEEFRNGIDKDGVRNIKIFVKAGGTLIVLNQAFDFAKEAFELPIRDEVENLLGKEFFCPGSTLKIKLDTSHPLCYGMPMNTLALFRYSPALRVSAGDFDDRVSILVRYHEENILQSGWLISEKYLSEKPAIIEFQIEKGKVIILAFPAQHRAQTHGTFKFLFNAIFYGCAEEVEF
jgi:hypothetical protein